MIRPYRASDMAALLAVNKANEPEVGPLDDAKADLLVREAGLVKVVEVENAIIGMMFLLQEGGTYASPNYAYFCGRHQAFAYVDRIALLPQGRGRGWGLQLYGIAERWAIDNNKAALCAEVNTVPDNPRSIRFHERFGFDSIEVLQPYGGEESVMMFEKLY